MIYNDTVTKSENGVNDDNKNGTVALLSVVALGVSANARDQIKIVGSSTVYPFTSYVAEEFKAITGNKRLL